MNRLIEILFFGLLLLLFYFVFKFKTKSEKEYEKKLKESLSDEFIRDPETGVKLTLKEAEFGHWISHDNEFHKISVSEISKLPTEDEKTAQNALNYLKESKYYKKTKLTVEQLKVFEKSKILNSYDDWTYSNPYSFEKGIVILPVPEIRGLTYYQDDYCESQIMFWVKINDINGHYLLREKTSLEKFLDLIRDDDEFKLSGYECFTFKKSKKIIMVKNILNNFKNKNKNKLEIEIDDDNLFVKTTKLVNLDDIIRIEKIIKNVY